MEELENLRKSYKPPPWNPKSVRPPGMPPPPASDLLAGAKFDAEQLHEAVVKALTYTKLSSLQAIQQVKWLRGNITHPPANVSVDSLRNQLVEAEQQATLTKQRLVDCEKHVRSCAKLTPGEMNDADPLFAEAIDWAQKMAPPVDSLKAKDLPPPVRHIKTPDEEDEVEDDTFVFLTDAPRK